MPHKSLRLVGKGLFRVSGSRMTRNPATSMVTPKAQLMIENPPILDRGKTYGAKMVAMAPIELTIPTALLLTIVGNTCKDRRKDEQKWAGR